MLSTSFSTSVYFPSTNSVFKPLVRVKRIPCESRKYSFLGSSTPSKFSRTESFKMAVRVCVFNVLDVLELKNGNKLNEMLNSNAVEWNCSTESFQLKL